jgi:hypothetical protein
MRVPIGGNMQNDLDRSVRAFLDMIGGEPLAGSGFENAEPDPEYSSEEEE